MNPDRRAALAALAMAPLAGCASTGSVTPVATPRTFVFVPGTWHGGWVWRPVVDVLTARGHRAFAVTCTGVGERHHLMSPDVGLDTHVADVVNCIEYEQLDQVVLVGFSFGGITITGVADQLRDRMAHLIYFDAFVPTRERPAWVERDANGDWPAWWQTRKAKFVDGYQMDFFAEYPMEMLLDTARYPAIAKSVEQRLTRHPARQWTDPVSFENGGWESLPRSYVHCVGQKFRPSSERMWGIAKTPGWKFRELPTDRLGMLTHPEQTALLLETLAG
jgi:pimeloyl-ACP methyl ester carboxylesterase